jgi:peptidyl-prolyl cis-trans isomerase B (cyclophilin B)
MKQEGIEGFRDRVGELALLPGPVGNQAVSLLGAEDEELIATLLRSVEPGRRLAAVEAWLGAGLPVTPEMEEDLLRDPYWVIPAVLMENMATSGDTTRAGETARRLLATSDDRDLRQALAGFLGTVLPEGESHGDLPEGMSGFRAVGHATIHTDVGDIELQLNTDFAPITCSAFCWLAWNGFYDGLYFHRVIPGFVAQAGCPQGNGLGGPGFSLPNERNLMRFRRGVVGMADSGLDTGGSQFFIMLDDHDRLDCRYTAFAAVAAGDSILDRITVGTRIESVSLEGPGD